MRERHKRASDVWLTEEQAKDMVMLAHARVEKAPSYEKQFKKAMRRGFFRIPCPCDLRISESLASMDLQLP